MASPFDAGFVLADADTAAQMGEALVLGGVPIPAAVVAPVQTGVGMSRYGARGTATLTVNLTRAQVALFNISTDEDLSGLRGRTAAGVEFLVTGVTGMGAAGVELECGPVAGTRGQ